MRSIGSRIRIQSAAEVRASLDTFGGGIVGKLDTSSPAPPGGESGVSYGAVFDDIDGRLATVQEKLVNAEDAHVRQLIQISDMKRSSEESTADLYNRQVAVRRVLAGLFGPDRGFEVAAIRGVTPQDLGPLSDQVGLTVKFLKEPAIEVPTSRAAGVVVDYAAMASSLETGLGEIVQIGDQLVRARKASDNTVIAKRQATAEFDALFPWAAQTVEGIFRMAGERELADRIRTSRRRVTGRQAVETEETGSAEPPAGDSEAQENAPALSDAADESQP